MRRKQPVEKEVPDRLGMFPKPGGFRGLINTISALTKRAGLFHFVV
jgi:hypothetical protein